MTSRYLLVRGLKNWARESLKNMGRLSKNGVRSMTAIGRLSKGLVSLFADRTGGSQSCSRPNLQADRWLNASPQVNTNSTDSTRGISITSPATSGQLDAAGEGCF